MEKPREKSSSSRHHRRGRDDGGPPEAPSDGENGGTDPTPPHPAEADADPDRHGRSERDGKTAAAPSSSRKDRDKRGGSDRDKQRDRQRPKERDRQRDGSREREREKDKEKEKEKERDRDRGKDSKERGRDRHRDDRDRDRDRDRERDRDRDRDREREKGGKEGRSKDELRERERLKEKEKEKERDRKRRDSERETKDSSRERDWRESASNDRKRRKRDDEPERERERERKQKDRDPAADKNAERDRDRDRERGGEELPLPERKRKRKDEDAAAGASDVKAKADALEDPEEEQKRLDDEMEKRRRRVQEWQDLRRKREEEERVKRGETAEAEPSRKKWTLEGEESDDEEPPEEEDEEEDEKDKAKGELDTIMEDAHEREESDKKKREETVTAAPPAQTSANMITEQEEEEEEVDPLDAFMNSMILPEVEKLNKEDAVAAATQAPKEPSKSTANDLNGNGNNKPVKKPAKNTTGRILPGDPSDSEGDDDVDEGGSGGANQEEDDDEFMKRVKKTKAEKLAIVDHSKIDYMPFRKNFYIEVKEISRMTVEDVLDYRKELEFKIRGKDVPRPVKTWNQTGLSSKILDIIKKLSFEKPMPIQAQAIPIIMSGRDCIGVAKTGSGKTLAFVLPMLRHIMDQPPLAPGDGPIGLIMAPTRELVQQIYNDIKKFSKALGLTCVPVYGGSGVAQQIGDLKRGAEIVVCTPGRMIDILCTSAGKITNLRRVTYLVMDEADRMFDMGFEPQITRIVQNTRPDRQTVLFSATFPRQVEMLARKVLIRPVEIQVGGRSVVNKDITQIVEVRPEGERFLRLLELLGEWCEKGKTLVFVHSQDKCDSLYRELLQAGYPCLSLHGAKEQSDRESTISDFKSNVCSLLIATSIAARGLDVKDLELVVNFDVPNHYEDYVHRVGRTGRAGRKGVAVTFISEQEARFAPDLVKALELSEQSVPEDLKKLADDFMAKVNEGKEQAHGSGYGGSGFKFNEEEDEAMKAAKKAQAKEYGYEEEKSDSDSDDDEIRKAGGGDMAQVAAAAAMAAVAARASLVSSGASVQPGLVGVSPFLNLPNNAVSIPGTAGVAGLSTLPALPGAAGIAGIAGLGILGRGLPGVMPNDGAARAVAVAAALNLQHNLAKIQADAMPEHYEAELEINDFPQHARWKVTHKDTLGPISDWTGAAITTRGQYYPSGKIPPPGERKLYLFLEGPTEASVKNAKSDIKRILEESTAASLMFSGGSQTGKYTVI